jgi:fatty-acyl-CoA synthase
MNKPKHLDFWPQHLPQMLTFRETPLGQNFDDAVLKYGDRRFISFYGRDISWNQADEIVEDLAGYLQSAAGFKKGERAILYSQNCPQFILAFYAIMKAGGVAVPVNPMNLASELTHYVRDSGAKVIVCGQELLPQTDHLEDSLTCRIAIAYGDYAAPAPEMTVPAGMMSPRVADISANTIRWSDALAARTAFSPVDISPDDLALLPYTSGTTSKPKGCIHTHATLQAANGGSARWESIGHDTVALVSTPLCHITGMQLGMNRLVNEGASIVLLHRWDPVLAASFIERYRVTVANMVPVMVGDLLSAPGTQQYDFSSILSFSGGGGHAAGTGAETA